MGNAKKKNKRRNPMAKELRENRAFRKQIILDKRKKLLMKQMDKEQ